MKGEQMLKIYGNCLSAFSNKVIYVADALKIQYEFKNLDFKAGDLKKEDYLAIHPAGKLPAIDDDGFILFESSAIIKYLADKKTSPLYPKDLKQRAIVEQWLDFGVIHIGGAIMKVTFNRIVAPAMGLPVDKQSEKDGVAFLGRFLPIVNAQLGKNEYLAGDGLSLADINLLAMLDPVEVGKIDIGQYENIVKWRNALKQQDFYTDHSKEIENSLKALSGA